MSQMLRKMSLALLAAAGLVWLPAQAPAKVRPLALTGGIVFTAGTVGCSVGALCMFIYAPQIRDDAKTWNSSSYRSNSYNYYHDGRYYSSTGKDKLDTADSMQTWGYVFTGAAIVSATMSVISWVNLKAPDDGPRRRPRQPRGETWDDSMFKLHEGELLAQPPLLRYEPQRRMLQTDVFSASF